MTENGEYEVFIIHSRAEEKAQYFYQALAERGQTKNLEIVSFDGVIATHLGKVPLHLVSHQLSKC